MEQGDKNMNRTVIQNIHAPVYGHVAGGDIYAPALLAPPTWDDLADTALHARLRAARAERWLAWRRSWLNLPMALMFVWLAGMLGYALSILTKGVFHGNAPGGINPLLFLLMITLPALVFMYRLDRIRRVEGMVAAAAQADIDQIELVLRRRAYYR